jgi:hypothetical protein
VKSVLMPQLFFGLQINFLFVKKVRKTKTIKGKIWFGCKFELEKTKNHLKNNNL